MKVVAILQARVSSSRLPNKVLLPILGLPMLAHQCRRVLSSKEIDKLIVATSQEVADDPIVDLCRDLNVSCFRGDLNDVLDRFYQAAKLEGAENIVRLTGDCPLADPDVIDVVISEHIRSRADYTSNCCPPTFPDGLDVEVMTFSALEQSWQRAKLPSEREHVTQYVRRKENNFLLHNYEGLTDLSSLRWTVDEPLDFDFVTAVYQRLYHMKQNFDTKDILRLLNEEPHIAAINSAFERNNGLLKSLQQDQLVIKS